MSKKQWILPIVGIILFIVFLIIPPIAPLTSIGMKAIGIFLFTMVWWATVSTGYPSIITIVLLVVTGVMPTKDAFAVSWGNWITLFVLGSFGMTEALRLTGFSRRFAYWFISRPFVAGHPWRLMGMFLLAVTSMGAIMSGTATTLVFLAVAEPLLEALGYKRGDSFAATFMMGIAWAATAAFSMTPIGHAGNILAIEWIKRDFGYSMSFVQWMAFGIPMGIVVLILLLLMFRFVVRPDAAKIGKISGNFVAEEVRKMGPMKIEEKVAAGVFATVVALWVFPGTLGMAFPAAGKYLEKLGFAIPALAGSCLLCVIQIKGKPLITFRQWMIGVEWDSVALITAIGIIGAVIENPKTGVTEFLVKMCTPLAKSLPTYGFLAFAILWVVLQTNVMSNLVSFTTVYAIIAPIVIASGTIYGPAMGIVIECASNYAFSLPSATTATAIIIGSKWVPVPFMAKYGIPLIIPIVLLFTFIGYPFAKFLYGG